MLVLLAAVQKSVVLEVGVTNPRSDPLTLSVTPLGHGLRGPASLTLDPSQRGVYPLVFAPYIRGESTGRSEHGFLPLSLCNIRETWTGASILPLQ